ncbi:SAP30-binding protein [Hyalella azteca]|uniref:SAP30-binding protein n=1 Tax=Hyalella azteca TaxID=294128 RepID=A0A8B7NNQ5_HYAAZ|nr:SAP30-binding protein [Hyalella azteca]
MSLGQLTANYADSDEEQFNDSLEEKKSSSRRTSSSTKSPADTGKRKTSDDLEESDTKSSHVAPELPKSLDTSSTSFTELSGVIEDDEDDAPPPSSAKASPINSRVEDLRGSEGNASAKASPASNTSGSNKATPVKKVNRLVSYANEEDDASEGSNSEDDEVLHSEPMDTGTDDDTSQPPGTHSGDSRSASRPSSPGGGITVTASGLVIIDGIKLPPAPVGKKCSQALQEKVAKAVAAVQRGEQNYNYSIQHKKEFRNPSIYEKLVEHLRLDENGTNYPVALYDPHCWGKESFYEELARIQKEEMEKREKERKERTKVDFIAGTKKVVEEETKKRKSRFDSGRPDMATSIAKPVALMSTLPAPTSAPKTTIDAFGSLNKKLKS